MSKAYEHERILLNILSHWAGHEVSPKSLADDCGMKTVDLYRYIAEIAQLSEKYGCGYHIESDDEGFEELLCAAGSAKEVYNGLKSGIYDHCISSVEYDGDERDVFLTEDERDAVIGFLNTMSETNHAPLPEDEDNREIFRSLLKTFGGNPENRPDSKYSIPVKRRIPAFPVTENRMDHVRKYEVLIRSAMDQNRQIHLNYAGSDGEEYDKYATPMKMIDNLDDNLRYFIDADGYRYRLDRIRWCRLTDRKAVFSEQSLYKDIDADRMFGVSSETEPTHVKVRIYKDNPEENILERVERTLSPAQRVCIREDGDGYIYEDDIYGRLSFYLWVQTFGSSMVILEPQDLREKAINAAITRYNNQRDTAEIERKIEKLRQS